MLNNFKKKIHRRIKTYYDEWLGQEVARRMADYESRVERLTGMIEELRQELSAQQLSVEGKVAVEALRLRKRLFALSRRVSEKAEVPPVPPPSPARTMDECLQELEKRAPAAFSHWKELCEANSKTYAESPLHSCSIQGHPMADLFQAFLTPCLAGRVLDIGCGPQPVPWYLEGYRRSHMAGIDPLPPSEGDHPFAFHQGVTEFLPWQDGVFDTIVIATSLDHVLLLDEALSEIRRVMTHDGILVVWVGFIKGALPYEPHREDIQPVDNFHLFHFDRPWFEEVITRYFIIEEDMHLTSPGISSFYALTPRRAANPQEKVKPS